MVELGASRWFHEEDLAFVFFVWEEADVVVFGVTVKHFPKKICVL